MDDDLAQLDAEQTRILALPGRVAWVKLARLNRTAKIFRGNAKVLLDHLRRMEDLGHMLKTTSDQHAFEEFVDPLALEEPLGGLVVIELLVPITFFILLSGRLLVDAALVVAMTLVTAPVDEEALERRGQEGAQAALVRRCVG